MFGEDANWGRVLCAIGYAEAEFDIDKVDVDFESEFGKIAVCRDGSGVEFSEEEAAKILQFKKDVDLCRRSFHWDDIFIFVIDT